MKKGRCPYLSHNILYLKFQKTHFVVFSLYKHLFFYYILKILRENDIVRSSVYFLLVSLLEDFPG